jgi:hypothetical protein
VILRCSVEMLPSCDSEISHMPRRQGNYDQQRWGKIPVTRLCLSAFNRWTVTSKNGDFSMTKPPSALVRIAADKSGSKSTKESGVKNEKTS